MVTDASGCMLAILLRQFALRTAGAAACEVYPR
jgi:hypothetical protein